MWHGIDLHELACVVVLLRDKVSKRATPCMPLMSDIALDTTMQSTTGGRKANDSSIVRLTIRLSTKPFCLAQMGEDFRLLRL